MRNKGPIEQQYDELDVQKMLADDRVEAAVRDILVELARAENMHPVWPADTLHQMAILQEEVGEAQMAANDSMYGAEHMRATKLYGLRRELVQVGAMAIRCLINLDCKQ